MSRFDERGFLRAAEMRRARVSRTDGHATLVMPPTIEVNGVIAALGRDVDVVAESPQSIDRVYLDTFDGRLHRAGLTLWRAATPTDSDLILEEPGKPALSAAASPSRRDRIFVDDLVGGAVRDRLDGVIEVRALLPQVRVRSRLRRFVVRNADGKTVVRVAVEEPTVVRPKRQGEALAARIHVSPVLGYERAFTRVRKLLEADLGLTPAPSGVVGEAKAAAGLPVGGVSSKVDIELDPNMRADHASILICQRLADIVEANVPGTLADIDIEFLHDLRVAVRRTRSILKEMKGVLPSIATDRARADLRWIQEITGPTRDLDVQLEGWPALISAVSPAMIDDLAPLHELLTRHRGAAFALMRRRLEGPRYDKAWRAWRELLHCSAAVDVDDGKNTPVAEAVGGRVVTVYRGIVKRGSAIDDTSDPEALHDLRKRGKELRYLLELFSRLWPATTVKPLVATLKGLQDVLGRFQDDSIQIHYLRGLGPELARLPGGTDSLIALGLVIDGLAADQRRAREAFAERFAPFAAAPTRKLVTSAFGDQPKARSRRGA